MATDAYEESDEGEEDDSDFDEDVAEDVTGGAEHDWIGGGSAERVAISPKKGEKYSSMRKGRKMTHNAQIC